VRIIKGIGFDRDVCSGQRYRFDNGIGRRYNGQRDERAIRLSYRSLGMT
jgi:hypothetical protein